MKKQGRYFRGKKIRCFRKLREKQKEEYENLRVELLQFKKDKIGSRNPAMEEYTKQEKKLLSAVELRRMKYLENKKIKRHEDEVLKKLNEFRKKLNSAQVQGDEDNWMNNRLKFHIDSARAYSDFDNKAKLGLTNDLKTETGEPIRARGLFIPI